MLRQSPDLSECFDVLGIAERQIVAGQTTGADGLSRSIVDIPNAVGAGKGLRSKSEPLRGWLLGVEENQPARKLAAQQVWSPTEGKKFVGGKHDMPIRAVVK